MAESARRHAATLLRVVAAAIGLILILGSSPFTCAAVGPQEFTDNIRLERGDGNSLRILVKGRNATLKSGSFKLNKKQYRVNESHEFKIFPCPLLNVSNEPFVLSTCEDRSRYFEHLPLRCLAGGKGLGPVLGLIVNGSLRARLADTNELLKPGVDYDIDKTLDFISRASTSSVPEGSKVLLDYSVYQRRIDTVVVDENGSAKLINGELSQFAPTPPYIIDGYIALANIIAPRANEPLERADVMPIWDRDVSNPDLDEANESAIESIKAKLKSQKSLYVVFVGDSVTCGSFSSTPDKAFPELFIKRLKDLYPNVEIDFTRFAVPGSTSSTMFNRFIKTALPNKKPDLIVVEFVNDLSLDQAEIEKNYTMFFQQAKARGSDVIVCLPHLVNPSLYGLKGWTEDSYPYYAQVRKLAEKNKVCVANVVSRWQNANYDGLTPSLLLADNYNHPNDRGHEIYVEELIKLLR